MLGTIPAMAALKLPTSRALAIVAIPTVKVRREQFETAAVVTRLSPSWIRIGVRYFPLLSKSKSC